MMTDKARSSSTAPSESSCLSFALPGIYFDRALDKTSDRELVRYDHPARGAWLEFEMDRRDTLGVRIDLSAVRRGVLLRSRRFQFQHAHR